MDRRSFLGSVLAALVAWLLPKRRQRPSPIELQKKTPISLSRGIIIPKGAQSQLAKLVPFSPEYYRYIIAESERRNRT